MFGKFRAVRAASIRAVLSLAVLPLIIKFQSLDVLRLVFQSILGSGCRELAAEFSRTQFSWHDLASSEVRELADEFSGTQCFVA